MAEAGLSWVRIGEFAWSKMEPSPGDLQFEWLDEVIEILGSWIKCCAWDTNSDASKMGVGKASRYACN